MDIRPFILQAGSLVDLSSTPIPVYGTEKGTTSSVRFEITDYLPSLANGSGANGSALTNGIGIMVEDYAMNSNYYFVIFQVQILILKALLTLLIQKD